MHYGPGPGKWIEIFYEKPEELNRIERRFINCEKIIDISINKNCIHIYLQSDSVYPLFFYNEGMAMLNYKLLLEYLTKSKRNYLEINCL